MRVKEKVAYYWKKYECDDYIILNESSELIAAFYCCENITKKTVNFF